MCNKLLQSYACGHSKTICTTACGHALKSTQLCTHLEATAKIITRSDSATSSFTPATCEASRNIISHPQTQPQPPTHATTGAVPTHIPAFRFVAPSTPSPTSPVSPVSPTFTARYPRSSAPPSRFPSPAPSATATEPKPTFCAYYVPRYLVTSKYPCIECYGKPEWERLRKSWVDSYRMGHPLDRVEDGEMLSGAKMAGKDGSA